MSVADLTGVEASRSISVEVGRQALDQRLLAEGDDPRHVAVGPFLERLAQERERVLAAGVADRVGQVDDEHRRQPIDRQHELEAGQREDERREQDASGRRARPAPPRAHPPAGREVEPDGQEQGRDEQQERQRGVEGDAHQAVPSVASGRTARAKPRRSRIKRVAVVDGPLDAEREEDEQDDRDPQLVAGRRSGRSGGRRPRRYRGAARGCRERHPGPRSSSADPGAIVDSSTSNRSTANRTGAYGSTGGAEATAEPGAPEALPPGLADGAPVGDG